MFRNRTSFPAFPQPHFGHWSIRAMESETESSQWFRFMVQHPCTSGSERGCETRSCSASSSPNTGIWQFSQVSDLLPWVGFVSGIKASKATGSRICFQQFHALRITACYQRSLIDPWFRMENYTVCLHLTPSRAKRCRFSIVSSETMSGRGHRNRGSENGTSLFHIRIQDAVEYHCLN